MLRRFMALLGTSIIIYLLLSSAVDAAHKDIFNVVYIDLSSEGSHYSEENKHLSDMAKNLAKHLKDYLSAKGKTVYINDGNQELKSLEDRHDDANKKHASLYLLISMKKTKKDCVNILYPKFVKMINRRAQTDADQNLVDALGNAMREGVSNDSQRLAELMLQYYSKNMPGDCCVVKASDMFLLRISSIPAVAIDFQFAEDDNLLSSIRHDKMDKVALVFSNAIIKFLTHPIGPRQKLLW